jgi:predicted nucleic acid-binding protein
MPWLTQNVYMKMNKQAALDSNVLVALVDVRDKWHEQAKALLNALKEEAVNVVYFDCVLNETISVLARRSEEQDRSAQFLELLDELQAQVPEPLITWITLDIQLLYNRIVALVRQTHGRLNFHDALIALACQELEIKVILSFDRDFDEIPWMERYESLREGK